MRVVFAGLVAVMSLAAPAAVVPDADRPRVHVEGPSVTAVEVRSESSVEWAEPNWTPLIKQRTSLQFEVRNTGTASGGPFPVTGVRAEVEVEFGVAAEVLFGITDVPEIDRPVESVTPQPCPAPAPEGTFCAVEIVFGDVDAGEVIPVQIEALALAAGEGTITVTLSQAEFDPDPSNNQAVLPVQVQEALLISGQKWFDRNGNGQRNPNDGEGPIDGVPLALLNANGDVVAEAQTGPVDVNGDGEIDPVGERGIFEIPLPPPGMYTLVEDLPAGWSAIPDGGVVELEVGQIPIQGIDLYNIPPVPPTPPDGLRILDWGDLPDSYPTTLAAGGPSHFVFPLGQLVLGTLLDVEADGVPTLDASGDDRFAPPDQLDDEDGLVGIDFSDGSMGTLTVRTNAAGFLDAWVDFLDDGTFGALDHIVKAAPVAGAGVHTFTFAVPTGASRGGYLRLRFHDVPGGLAPGGFSWNGEVEDYLANGLDLGDANQDPLEIIPGMPFGYPVRIAVDGARHLTNDLVRIGELVDAETDLDAATAAETGLASNTATGDDNDPDDNQNDGPRDDEDGIAFGDGFVPFTIQLPVETGDPSAPNPLTRYGLVAGTTGTLTFFPNVDGGLDGWVDWNRDGDWDDDGEQVFANERIGPGTPPPMRDLTAPAGASVGYTHARFRFSRNGALQPVGLAPDGEVEDYLMAVFPPLDYGDAPAPYPSSGADGSRHAVGPVRLGTESTADADATADDGDDGVVMPGDLRRGRDADLTVTVEGDAPGALYAWIDWNRDGDWDDDGERVVDGRVMDAGDHALSVPVPATAVPGETWMRFRVSRVPLPFAPGADLDATAVPFVTEGEVEDYAIEISGNPVASEEAPAVTALEGHGPNPARSAVTLRLALAAPADVRVAVFDALGRRVLRLPAAAHRPGRHDVRLAVEALPAGVYVVVVDAGEARFTRSVVVVR